MNRPSPLPQQRQQGQRRGKMLQTHIIYRTLLFLIALATLIIFVYVAVKFGPHDGARRYPVAISAAALALLFDGIVFFTLFRAPSQMGWIVALDIVIIVLAFVGGVTVLFTHYAGDGPDLRPYGYAEIDGVPMAMAFVLG
ncbi:hypothetical protein BJY01DRAFT_255272 [Aspergillus pseudoustus]|uniref:MARVEL domain-containing protein n=1 Tax=Aspergillus pseudoustus TaxID=1810923 RepID=A0ABR4ILZ3_9EURO